MRNACTPKEGQKVCPSRFLFIGIILCMSTVSCTVEYHRTYAGPLKPIEDVSLIYNPYTTMIGGEMKITKIDGRESSKFPYFYYMWGWIELEPGKHELEFLISNVDFLWLQQYYGDHTCEARLEPGRVYEPEMEVVDSDQYQQTLRCRLADITGTRKGREAKRGWLSKRE